MHEEAGVVHRDLKPEVGAGPGPYSRNVWHLCWALPLTVPRLRPVEHLVCRRYAWGPGEDHRLRVRAAAAPKPGGAHADALLHTAVRGTRAAGTAGLRRVLRSLEPGSHSGKVLGGAGVNFPDGQLEAGGPGLLEWVARL